MVFASCVVSFVYLTHFRDLLLLRRHSLGSVPLLCLIWGGGGGWRSEEKILVEASLLL